MFGFFFLFFLNFSCLCKLTSVDVYMFGSIRLALKSILFLLLDTITTVCVAATDESTSQSLATQSVLERPELSASAGSLLEMQGLRPHPRPAQAQSPLYDVTF